MEFLIRVCKYCNRSVMADMNNRLILHGSTETSPLLYDSLALKVDRLQFCLGSKTIVK